jgi:hypothetical protein
VVALWCTGVILVWRQATGIFDCNCHNDSPYKKPKNFNYQLHFMFAQDVFVRKMYLNSNVKDWGTYGFRLFEFGTLRKYQPVQGKALRERFFSDMVNEVKARHNLTSASAGYETHADIQTPYDKLMLSMVREIDHAADLVKLNKTKADEEASKRTSKLGAIESVHCEVISAKKATGEASRVGVVDLQDGDDDDAAPPVAPVVQKKEGEKGTSKTTNKRVYNVDDDDDLYFNKVLNRYFRRLLLLSLF